MITMMVDTEVVVVEEEEDITENEDHHLITKTGHATIGHVHVLTLHVSLTEILIIIFYPSTLSGNPVFFFKLILLTFVIPLFFLVFFSGFI